MYWTCFRGFLISTQLVLQGHIPESYTITSKSAEAVALAQKFNLYPEKMLQWVKKDRKDAVLFRRLLGKLFPEKDPLLQPNIFNIYELTSEYGRHPNFSSTVFYSDFGQLHTENTVFFSFNDHSDESNFLRTFNYVIFSYLSFLRAFSTILGDYLSKEWKEKHTALQADFKKHTESIKGSLQS